MLGNFKFERGSLERKNSHTVWKFGNSPEFLGSLGFFRAFICARYFVKNFAHTLWITLLLVENLNHCYPPVYFVYTLKNVLTMCLLSCFNCSYRIQMLLEYYGGYQHNLGYRSRCGIMIRVNIKIQ